MKHNYMENIKKPKNKFAAGEPRYCQNCGKESHDLFEINRDTKGKNQLLYCQECRDKYRKLN
jgi:predicted SprT family Zn-dependent metalloprotease